MNLLTHRVKYVKSYEREGAMMIAPVRANKLAAHEAHVGFKVKLLRGLANYSMRARSAHRRPAHKAVEVGDRGRLSAGSRQKKVKYRRARTEYLGTSRNRKRCCCGRAVVAVRFEGGACQFRHQAGRCERAQGDSRFFEKTSTTQEPFSEVAMTRIGHAKRSA